jgi:AraC-like DNA-binding protein
MSVEAHRRLRRSSAATAETRGARSGQREYDVEQRAPEAPAAPFVVDAVSATELRMSFRVGDSWCRASNIELRSGVRLGVTTCQFDPTFAFSADQPPSDFDFVLAKGAVLEARANDGRPFRRGGNTLQLGRTKAPLRLQVRAMDDAPMECVSISMSAARLRELWGSSALPDVFRNVIESRGDDPLISQAMTPRLFRLLDEILYADVRGAARSLWHEAKALELVALMTDELVETSRAREPHVSTHDIDRLERVRKCLIEHLATPPSLAELAGVAGFNETLLKNRFRALFGAPVFAYLRQVRMEEARRLLLERHLNVTEVAQRVGYANPSKFAAAFRRQFGMSPSAV